MILNRRTLLLALPCIAVWPARGTEFTSPLTAYENATGGRAGVYAQNLVTGANISWRARDRFVMCSTFKASLAALVLARIDRGEDKFESPISYTRADLAEYAPIAQKNLAPDATSSGTMSVGAMCAGVVEYSDNTCANLLLARVGGSAALTEFWRSIGDTVSRLDHNEPLLNRTPLGAFEDTTTPEAMAATLRRLVLGDTLSATSRERLTGWMVNCKTGDKRLRAGLPKEWKIANKTGNNGQDAFGDIAVVWTTRDNPVLICVYTRGGSPSPEQVETVFADIGHMVGERLQ